MEEFKMAKGDKNITSREDFSFDHNREFIKLVEQETSELEEKYNLS